MHLRLLVGTAAIPSSLAAVESRHSGTSLARWSWKLAIEMFVAVVVLQHSR